MPHIIDAINAAEKENRPYIAFEFYPPRTAEGVANLTRRFARMLQQSAWPQPRSMLSALSTVA